MKYYYITPFLLLLCVRGWSQDCSKLTFTYSSRESRCTATGSIDINATGGSGNYSYKVSGPITPPVTSSRIVTGLPSGYYSIVVKDMNYGCSKRLDSVFVSGSYSDPRFQLTKIDATCAGNDGSISSLNQRFGRSPFSYTIIAPSPVAVGQTNSLGNFNNLIAGEYYVQLKDSCGGIQVRRVTVNQFVWDFGIVSIRPFGCDSANAIIGLKANNGITNSMGSNAFSGFRYGVVRIAGDTSWFNSNSFTFYTAKHHHLVIVVKDACGKLKIAYWDFPASLLPKAGPVLYSNVNCSNFSATVSLQQNLSSPVFYLKDALGNTITSNNSGVFANLAYGSYCINVVNQCYDTTIQLCFILARGVPSLDPTVIITNRDCSSFSSALSGKSNLTSPNYCIYDSKNALVSCNSTGIFNNLKYGSYCVKTHDGCTDTTIVRCFSVTKPIPVLTSYTLGRASCLSFDVTVTGSNLNAASFCLYDSAGKVVACDSSGIFTGLTHGRYCIKAVSCGGDTSNTICFSSVKPVPSVGSWINLYNQNCNGLSAAIIGQANLTNPQYCLYNSRDSLLICNKTGVFNSLSYGYYCIKIHNSCYDTTIIRCFNQLKQKPSVNATLIQYNSTCSNFSAKVNGNNLTNPEYCLFNSLNKQINCNTTGVFDNLPYGSYCVTVHDSCTDTTIKICQNFYFIKGFSVKAAKSCSIGVSNISINFNNSNGPYNIKILHPNGTKINDTTSWINPLTLALPALPVGIQYKVIGTDNCGQADSTWVTPDAALVTHSSTVKSKCPSGIFLNGAGDINASSTSNLFPLTPTIIGKNGVDTLQNFSSFSSNQYTFSDLSPAQYVVEYTMQTCNNKIRDTVVVMPYTYPSQGQSAIYQCDNKGFSLGANLRGGVSPFSYQIIGSTPEMPTITSVAQASPVFNINNGTVYSLVRLRSIDACGNATLNDVSVLPLQNISIRASSNCYYQTVTLTTDTIPTANYLWFKRTSATDSVLVDSGLSHNLPFFVPEQSGQYICKANVNNGCVTRLSYFTLSGNCSFVLPVSLTLQGKVYAYGNQLLWNGNPGNNISSYTVERKSFNGLGFIGLGDIREKGVMNYLFTDYTPDPGENIYRLRINYYHGFEYSNIIKLDFEKNTVVIYPNPAQGEIHILLNALQPSDYKLQLFTSNGRLIYYKEIKKVNTKVIDYKRETSVTSGMYILIVTDLNTNKKNIQKILFQ